MNFSLMVEVFPYFLEAALVTVEISALAILIGLSVGALATSAKLSRFWPLRFIGTAYVSVFRGTPCLLQLFVLYFGGPQIGINLEPFAAGAIGLGLNIGAYYAEAMRGAILTVDTGQNEAARSIGFSNGQSMRFVVLPQAARLMIRSLGVNTVMLIKGSALVSAISVVELTYTAQRFIGSTYRPFEIFGIAAAIYMVLIYIVARFVDFLEARYALK
ncbi:MULTISPECIES: amino acid ABC transporter permease [Brucella/Ochrobactrum group]|jgi:polar amino acid transport system permease protein|uniref:Polar amino acid ABC transporter, inner membrane subunit n=3 Tax=Brucella TaxID=234 RepID=A6X4P9_BRUA4|nr:MULTISPECIES: amino acid ABC transporter permease [Brucella/Ochrobactrum group]QOD65395.1 amino acid ABC transporter permease [Ochrobactrum sp. MT180101]ABS16203.1 polar amino acid ABC transporter, inner membrane subunit [Brucella anthropi ATCC 49188]AIK41733.1 amino ABC transporter, permease, 3-TM region, His/Glu/Gln/Arg/opine family domain protein [Brucella anthropi]EXL06187.1 nickel transporter [Brucella anthropi]KAB2741979.1 amino acid ABC transporter permease [Brucella anthropi]